MDLRRVLAVTRRLYHETRHSPAWIFDTLYWPFLDLLVWGLVSTFLARGDVELPVPVGFLLGATLLWGLLFRSQLTISVSFMIETWSRNIIGLMATPLRTSEWLAGTMLWNIAQMAVSWTIMAAMAFVLFRFNVLEMGLALLPFVVALMLFGVAVGMFALGILVRVGTGADILAWGLAGLISPVSATYYPVGVLPGWAQAVARALPTSHVFESMRAVLGGAATPWGELGIAFGLDAVYIGAAALFARHMLETMRRRGLVTRYA